MSLLDCRLQQGAQRIGSGENVGRVTEEVYAGIQGAIPEIIGRGDVGASGEVGAANEGAESGGGSGQGVDGGAQESVIEDGQDKLFQHIEGVEAEVGAPALGDGVQAPNPRAYANPFEFASLPEVQAWARDAGLGAGDSTQLIDTPERKVMRVQAAEDMLSMLHPVRNERLIRFVMGAPGAGKSTLTSDAVLAEFGAVLIDSDDAKRNAVFSKDYQGGLGANKLHAESVGIANTALELASNAGMNIVNVVVGQNYEKLAGKMRNMEAAGYTVSVEYVDVSPAESYARTVDRYYKDGRYVRPDYVLQTVGVNPAKNYIRLMDDGILSKEDWRVFNNEVERGESPREIGRDELTELIESRSIEEVSNKSLVLGRVRGGLRAGSDRHAGESRSGLDVGESAGGQRGSLEGILRGEIALDDLGEGDSSGKLYQENKQGSGVPSGHRGFFDYVSKEIGLTADANVSTFVHEMGHAYLFALNDRAVKGERVALADMAAFNQWLGVKDGDSLLFREGDSGPAREAKKAESGDSGHSCMLM